MSESIIALEEVVELEAQVLQNKLFEQYVDKLIALLDLHLEVYSTAVELGYPLLNGGMPLEIFSLCTAPLEARYEAATFVLGLI